MPAITTTDLNNAKVDVDHIADIANSTNPTATDRMGNVKQTISGITTAGKLALSVNVYSTTAAGLVGTTLNSYFSVPSATDTESLILYQNQAGTAVEIKKYQSTAVDSLTVNKGNDFPQKSMTRGGITSVASSTWNNLILQVRVVNAVKGEYYKIAYQQNEAALDGESKFDWIIQKFDSATYAATGTAYTLVSYQTNPYGVQEQIVRNSGTQTVSLYPYTRPEMRFDITVDTTALPAAGTPINSYSSDTNPAWSWIIDPSCYEYKDETVVRSTSQIPNNLLPSTLLLDQGESYPNKNVSRNGVITASNSFLLDCILKVKVVGAREGYYYGVRYFKNGSTALAGPVDGWIIEEQLASTYASTFTATRVVNYVDAAPTISRVGIQTVRLVSPTVSGLEFYITLDTTKLPAYGTFISMLTEGVDGSSWIIDPSCYEYSPTTQMTNQSVTYSLDGLGNANIVWQSGNSLCRVRFGPNGYNSLPNIKGIDRTPFVTGGSRDSVLWTQINTATTDWLPPLVVEAMNNGDGHASIYTGGNHGADGSAGGGNTARNTMYKILVDGQPFPEGIATSGACSSIQFIVINEIMAYNTTGTVDPVNFPGRYVIRQSFVVDFQAGSAEVQSEVRAYESVTVKTDNGPQMVTTGFQDTMLYVGGQYENRITFDPTSVSGSFVTYPDCWAVVLQDDVNGQQVSWMDREYEAGDGRYIGGTASAIRGGGASNTKFYHAAVASYSHLMAAGAKYKWRGGYAWQSPNIQSANFDSLVSFRKASKSHTACIVSASNYTVLP
jgi:hypothetical protein